MEVMVAGAPGRLLGRDAERAAIDALLDGARGGGSGALVFRGGPGLGKTALLDDAARRADGLRILRATGAEPEADLPFAGLHQLLRPVLDRTGALPAPQAAALRQALGLESGAAPAPLLLGAAVLGLLAEAAPVAALSDDGQWLDAPSLAALAFAGRRLRAEGIALVAAVRDEAPPTGLRERPLAPLGDDAAAELLGELAPAVRRALIEAAAGNPLALVELPAALSAEQLAGRAPLEAPLPVPAQLEELFTARLVGLDAGARSLLLLAAAEGTGDPALGLRASTGSSWALPLAARCLGLVAADAAAGDAHLAEALRLHHRHRRPLDLARTELLLGERLRRARRKAEARGPLRAALEAFESAGAAPWADRARDELRAAGESAPRRGHRPLDRLTPQELQVARLVARGDNNRDVAAALFLSPRTVEYHLHKVFRKLGVHARAELAAALSGGETG